MLNFRIVIRNMFFKIKFIKFTNSIQSTFDEICSSLHKKKSSIQLNEFILKQSKFKFIVFVSKKIFANFAKKKKKVFRNVSSTNRRNLQTSISFKFFVVNEMKFLLKRKFSKKRSKKIVF